MSPPPTAASVQHLLRDEDLDQSRVAAGGGGVQRRPQLVVLRVDAGAPVQQDLHHLFVVVDATLGWAEREDSLEGCSPQKPEKKRTETQPSPAASLGFIGNNILTSKVAEV